MTVTAASRQGGFTLAEIVIVLFIVAMMVYIAIPGVGMVTRSRLKDAARTLAGALKFLYNYSATHNLYCRMAFDIDERKYSAECSEDRYTLMQEKEKSFDGRRVIEEKEEEDEATATFGLLESEKEAWRLKHYKVTFQQVTSRLLAERTLPDGIDFDGVWVIHQSERYTAGDAYIYFFPSGYVERSIVHLADSSGRIYSLDIFPLSGRVKVVDGYVEVPD